jgi:hypothetical protein
VFDVGNFGASMPNCRCYWNSEYNTCADTWGAGSGDSYDGTDCAGVVGGDAETDAAGNCQVSCADNDGGQRGTYCEDSSTGCHACCFYHNLSGTDVCVQTNKAHAQWCGLKPAPVSGYGSSCPPSASSKSYYSSTQPNCGMLYQGPTDAESACCVNGTFQGQPSTIYSCTGAAVLEVDCYVAPPTFYTCDNSTGNFVFEILVVLEMVYNHTPRHIRQDYLPNHQHH